MGGVKPFLMKLAWFLHPDFGDLVRQYWECLTNNFTTLGSVQQPRLGMVLCLGICSDAKNGISSARGNIKIIHGKRTDHGILNHPQTRRSILV